MPCVTIEIEELSLNNGMRQDIDFFTDKGACEFHKIFIKCSFLMKLWLWEQDYTFNKYSQYYIHVVNLYILLA